jgi:hypothetical protein
MVQQYLPIKNNVLITGNGTSIVKNITAATVVKPVAGRIARISVLVAGSTTGSVNDCATTGTVASANEVAVIPDVVGVYAIDLPCSVGIVVTPGTGQTLAVSYS